MKRVVIFANGDIRGARNIPGQLSPSDIVLCADGGARHALALGIKPSLVIGDLDSVEEENLLETLEMQGIKLQRFPREKDETDLELAFACAINEGATEILLLSALGGRLDHWLGNMLLLAREQYSQARITVLDDNQRGIILRNHDSLDIAASPGDTFSLIPLSPEVSGVTIKGCKWPLHEAMLEFGSPLSISNYVTGHSVSVAIESGVALAVIISAAHP